MTFNETTNESPKLQIARKESELQNLLLKRESLKEKIKLVPVRNAQILFYAGLAVCATVFGLIVIGPAMVIGGGIYWYKCAKMRIALQEELSQLEDTIGKVQTEVNLLRASIES